MKSLKFLAVVENVERLFCTSFFTHFRRWMRLFTKSDCFGMKIYKCATPQANSAGPFVGIQMTLGKSTNHASHQPAQRRKMKTGKIRNSRHTTRWNLLCWIFCVQINSPIHTVFYVISFFSVFAEIMHNTLNILFSRAFHNLIELSNLNFISCLNPMISFLEFHFVHRSALYGFSQLLSIDLESEDLNSPWISFSVFWVFSVVLCNATNLNFFGGKREKTLGIYCTNDEVFRRSHSR